LKKSKISGSRRIEVKNSRSRRLRKSKISRSRSYMKSKIEAFEGGWRFEVWRLNPSLRLK
jgi:hypothetical protein